MIAPITNDATHGADEHIVNVTVKTPVRYKERAEAFIRSYTLYSIAGLTDNRKLLKKRTDRVCRFCGKDNTQTSFKHNAHLIPAFLGNKSNLSDFECDSCNAIFSAYENHLANYLSAERSLTQAPGRSGIPKFKAPLKSVEITNEKFYNKDSVQITRPSTDNSTFTYDKKNERFDISFRRNSFVPNLAYKALLKIALSILPENDALDYKRLKRYLCEAEFGELTGCTFWKYSLPFNMFISPHVLLFKKINQAEEGFTHLMSLTCLNYIFWVPVMLNDQDMYLFEKPKTLKIPPPLFVTNEALPDLSLPCMKEDWSSVELKKDEIQQLSMHFNSPDWRDGLAIDPTTGEKSKQLFSEKEALSLILVKNDGIPLDLMPEKNV